MNTYCAPGTGLGGDAHTSSSTARALAARVFPPAPAHSSETSRGMFVPKVSAALRCGVMGGQWGSMAMPATCGQSDGPREHPGAPVISTHGGETRPHRGQLRRTERLVHQYNHREKPHSADPHPDPGGAAGCPEARWSPAWAPGPGAPGRTPTWPSECVTHLDNNQSDNNRLT